MGRLDGKIAIVTGGARGQGEAEVRTFVDEGAQVVFGDVLDERGEKVAADVGGAATYQHLDVTSEADWDAIVATTIEQHGRIDVLVNNAGILRDKMIFSMSEEDFDSVIRVHMKGTFAPMHHASVYWREQSKAGNQPRASIINTSSGAGLQGNIGQTNYAGAKAGIAAMTIVASLELARYGVRANVVCPGGMTRLAGQIVKDMELKEPEEYTEFTPMNPANSAPIVAWLASDESITVTGQVFRAVGNLISHYVPWTIGTEIVSKDEGKCDPADISAAVYSKIFKSRHPGLQMGQ